jgi:hypothetical protein
VACNADKEWLQFTNAIFGLIGVVLAVLLIGIKEWWRERQDRKRHANYLAIRVVCVLDEFCERCTEIVSDDGKNHGQRGPNGELEPQVSLPDGLIFPDNVDWKAIDPSLMYRILALPSRIKTDNNAVSFISEFVSFPPDFDEYFEERQYRYACRGLEAVELAQALRSKYTIPDREFGDWDPTQKLRDRKAEIENLREERERNHKPFP